MIKDHSQATFHPSPSHTTKKRPNQIQEKSPSFKDPNDDSSDGEVFNDEAKIILNDMHLAEAMAEDDQEIEPRRKRQKTDDEGVSSNQSEAEKL